MVKINLTTEIAAPVERCFDLSRSIDLHLVSTEWTGERAVAGVTSGLIGEGQQVKWRARFLGLPVTHTSLITKYEFPRYFQDAMVAGVFQSYCHDHYFAQADGGTVMQDLVCFTAPWGVLGTIAERAMVRRHMVKLLEQRNRTIKQIAESADWPRYLPGP